MNSDFQTMIKILNILQKYEIRPGEFSAEHNVIYFNIDPIFVSEYDTKELDKLGVHIDYAYDCFAFFT